MTTMDETRAFLERLGLPNSQTQLLTEEGGLGDIIESDPQDLNQSQIRFVRNGIIMNLRTAKALHSWLGDHIKHLEQLQSSKANND